MENEKGGLPAFRCYSWMLADTKKESTPGEAVSIGAFLVFFRALSYKGDNEPIPQVLKQVVNLSCYLLYF